MTDVSSPPAAPSSAPVRPPAITVPMPTVMTPDLARLLREPFAPEYTGKRPLITCPACRGSRNGKVCDSHRKSRCEGCHNYITSEHIHLDYVGHAEVTDRLLAVDPLWSWEPTAFDADGLPKLDSMGGLWIRLTVAGVPRLGYGHADGKTGPDAVKETIGDAIRNAAMRFGVALDLWGAKFKAAEVEAEAAVRASMPGYVDDWDTAIPVGAGRPPVEQAPPGPARVVDKAPKPAAHNPTYYPLGVNAINAAATLGELDALAARVKAFAGAGEVTDAEAGRLKLKIGARRDELCAAVPTPEPAAAALVPAS
jgi:hypothetical protein